MTVPRREDPTAVAYAMGRRQGRVEGRLEALGEVNDFVVQMLAATRPELPSAHFHGCYRRHPWCALKSIHAFVLRAEGPS